MEYPAGTLERRGRRRCTAAETASSMLSIAVSQLILLLLCLDGVAADGTNSSNTTVDAVMPDTLKTVTIKDPNSAERIETLNPGYLDLSCTVADAFDGKPDSIKGYWTKDGEEISQSQVTIQRKTEGYYLENRFYINGSSLGNYSCVFLNGRNKVTKTFFIYAPSMKDKRDKPIVSYSGDSTVLTCKIHPAPLAWHWYKVNSTEKEMINVTDSPPRYKTQVYEDEVRLTMVNLVEEDTGTYVCIAVYPIGSVQGEVLLQVITFMEPLKPFLVVLVEVVLLMFLILLFELQGRRRSATAVTENGTIDQTEKLRKEEPTGTDESKARQRKV